MAASSPDPAPVPAEPPNLRHLRLFLAVLDAGSVTHGAERVYLSQPAASQGLARLARIFGMPLIDRQGPRLRPTEAGTILAARARRALGHLSGMGRAVQPRSRLGRGMVVDALDRHVTAAQLRSLATFAEHRSFTGAARALGQTEPAVHRAVREFERLVGTPLIEGAGRSFHLTEAGDTVARLASLALREIAAAQDELRELRGRFDGHLVIGTLPLVRTRIVPEAVAALVARHPEATVEILDGNYGSMAERLRMGTCDLIVGALREGTLEPGLTETVLFDDGLCLVARAGHPLAGRPVVPADLDRFPWVLPRRDTPSRAVFDRLQAQAGLRSGGRGFVETGSLVALRGLLVASDAVSIISRRQIEYEIRQGLLVVLDHALPDATRPIGVTTLAGWQPTRLQGDFLSILRAVTLTEGADDRTPADGGSRP